MPSHCDWGLVVVLFSLYRADAYRAGAAGGSVSAAFHCRPNVRSWPKADLPPISEKGVFLAQADG